MLGCQITGTNSLSKLCIEHAQCVIFTGATLTRNRPGYNEVSTYMVTAGLGVSVLDNIKQ